ncbi:hypothetical protein Tco_0986366, partial [Tanacetum coccineum]
DSNATVMININLRAKLLSPKEHRNVHACNVMINLQLDLRAKLLSPKEHRNVQACNVMINMQLDYVLWITVVHTWVFTGDIYGDHVVSYVGIIGIKHRYNVVRNTLVDICYHSGISAGKEVDIGFDGGRDKPLRPADILLYSWDGGLDVCVDLTGSSPLTQTGMVDFVTGRAVIVAAQRKHGKYMDMCAAIGYGFLPFSFSSMGELEADAVTLLKRIQKFSITQDIGARVAIHIFNRISFAIAKGVRAQINASVAKDDLRKACDEFSDIPQETCASIDTYLKQESDKDYEMHNALF